MLPVYTKKYQNIIIRSVELNTKLGSTNICKNCKGHTCSNCETVIVAEEIENDINDFKIQEITVDKTADNNDNTPDEDSENGYDRPVVIPEYIKRVQLHFMAVKKKKKQRTTQNKKKMTQKLNRQNK